MPAISVILKEQAQCILHDAVLIGLRRCWPSPHTISADSRLFRALFSNFA